MENYLCMQIEKAMYLLTIVKLMINKSTRDVSEHTAQNSYAIGAIVLPSHSIGFDNNIFARKER